MTCVVDSGTIQLVVSCLLIWFVLGCIGAGFKFAYEQREFFSMWEEFPEHREILLRTNKDEALLCIFLGPVFLFGVIKNKWYTYGWLWAWSKRATLEAKSTTAANKAKLPQQQVKTLRKDSTGKRTLHELKVTTYNPDKYVLLNEEDGTQWRGSVKDGHATWVTNTKGLNHGRFSSQAS